MTKKFSKFPIIVSESCEVSKFSLKLGKVIFSTFSNFLVISQKLVSLTKGEFNKIFVKDINPS